VKRAGPLKRGEPLKRSGSLKRTSGLDRSNRKSRTSSLRAKPLDPAEADYRRLVREAVFRRDGYRCRLAGVDGAGDCAFGLTPHHVLKSKHGGAYDESNLVALCAHHNDEIEANADLAALARRLGLVRRSSEKSADPS